jgi:hypothetical protein
LSNNNSIHSAGNGSLHTNPSREHAEIEENSDQNDGILEQNGASFVPHVPFPVLVGTGPEHQTDPWIK